MRQLVAGIIYKRMEDRERILKESINKRME